MKAFFLLLAESVTGWTSKFASATRESVDGKQIALPKCEVEIRDDLI